MPGTVRRLRRGAGPGGGPADGRRRRQGPVHRGLFVPLLETIDEIADAGRLSAACLTTTGSCSVPR
ncbi:hypothetical protein HBB16_15240 [Pseudonocardia sp. MCCB 268]|nr:hypothetical protein [Pseudonocardia cytotoxica]